MSTATAARKLTVTDSWNGVKGMGFIGSFPPEMSIEEAAIESARRASELTERLQQEDRVLRGRIADRLAGTFGEDVRDEVARMSIEEALEFCES